MQSPSYRVCVFRLHFYFFHEIFVSLCFDGGMTRNFHLNNNYSSGDKLIRNYAFIMWKTICNVILGVCVNKFCGISIK